jgi:hypothetical protein
MAWTANQIHLIEPLRGDIGRTGGQSLIRTFRGYSTFSTGYSISMAELGRGGVRHRRSSLSSTIALFDERRSPGFPGFTRRTTHVFENPAGREGVQEVEMAGFSRLNRMIGLRKRAKRVTCSTARRGG